jgi:hypothetical protein
VLGTWGVDGGDLETWLRRKQTGAKRSLVRRVSLWQVLVEALWVSLILDHMLVECKRDRVEGCRTMP